MGIIIFGCGSAGQAVYWAATTREDDIIGFCDDRLSGGHQYGLPIMPPAEAARLYGNSDTVFVIAIPHSQPIKERLLQMGVRRVITAAEALEGVDYTAFPYTKDARMAVEEVNACVAVQKANGGGLAVRSVDLVVTERCSLKCRECSNLMQYYRHPQDYGVDTLLTQMRSLLDMIDTLYELRIIGGEPLMNKNVYALIQTLAADERIRRIVIFTNATLVPPMDKWPLIRHDKVSFSITDYGGLSVNRANLEEALRREQIAYTVDTMDSWSPCSSIRKHHRNDEEQRSVFQGCCAKNLVTLLNGKLYRCPFMANAMNLGAVPNTDNDYLTLSDFKQRYPDYKERLRAFLYQKDCFATCDYCAGRPFGGEKIPPAEQTAAPLSYEIVSL